MNFVLPVRNYRDSRLQAEQNFLPQFLRNSMNDNEKRVEHEIEKPGIAPVTKENSSSQPAGPTAELNAESTS